MIDVKGNVERYYVALRPQTNETHSVHREGCPFMPEDNKRIYLGVFHSGIEAGMEGIKFFPDCNCCRFCSKESSINKSQASIIIKKAEQYLCVLN